MGFVETRLIASLRHENTKAAFLNGEAAFLCDKVFNLLIIYLVFLDLGRQLYFFVLVVLCFYL